MTCGLACSFVGVSCLLGLAGGTSFLAQLCFPGFSQLWQVSFLLLLSSISFDPTRFLAQLCHKKTC